MNHRKKITQKEYNRIMSMKPEKRTANFGDDVTNRIIGILIGFSKKYEMRDGWIDIITTREAEKEIKQLIVDCGGNYNGLSKNVKLEELAKEWKEAGILDGLMAANPNSSVFDVFKNPKQLEIEKLEKELVNRKNINRDLWNSYGSELCAGDLLRKEKIIQDKIDELKEELEDELDC